MEGRGCLRTPQSECDIALHNVDINLQTAPPDDQETLRRLGGGSLGCSVAGYVQDARHFSPITTAPSAIRWCPAWWCALSRTTTPPAAPCLKEVTRSYKEMETPDTQEKQEEKGSRPPTHTHTKGIVTFFKTLEINYFPCAFLKPAYWVSLRRC